MSSFDELKHELSQLGFTAHLHKSAPDVELLLQLVAALRSARDALHAAAERERDAAAIVDAAKEAARVTHEHASTLARENAALRTQSRRLAERVDERTAALTAATAATALHDQLQQDRAEQATALAQLAAELEHAAALRTALARADARARDAERQRHELEALAAQRGDSAARLQLERDSLLHAHEQTDSSLRGELARVQRMLDETRGLHSVALAALDEQTRARDAGERERALLVARVEQLADADDERAGLLAELNDAYRYVEEVEADRARLVQLVHQCERSLAEVQQAIDAGDLQRLHEQQRSLAAAPADAAPAPAPDDAPRGRDVSAASMASRRRSVANGERAHSTSPPPPAPRAAAPNALDAALAANAELRAHIDGLERNSAQLVMTMRDAEARERDADNRARVAEQHQRDLAKWVDELRKYITDTTAQVRERESEVAKKVALLEQQANKHGAELAAVERERDALQHYISCYEAELIKTTVR
jgi:chromosome segregation ATPase